MLKIARGFGHKTSGKHRLKYRLDVWVEKVDNLPKPLKKCRVVWSRGPKLQMTDTKDVSNSVAVFKQKLSQIATIYKDPQEGFEAKEYKFQLQVPGKDSSAKLITVGKGELDLSFFVAQEGVAQSKMVPIICKVGAASTAYLKITITAEQVTGALDDDDGMTEVSGMTGMTAAHLGEEQDLSGFDEPEPASSAKPRASRLSAAPSPAAVLATPVVNNKAATRRAVPAGIEEEADGDVSPFNLSPSSSVSDPSREPGGRGAGKPSVIADKSKAAVAAGKKLTSAKADLFGSGAPAGSSRPRAASKASELTEDEARAELFSSSSNRAHAAAARPLKAPASSKASSAPSAGGEPGLPVAAAAVQRQGSSSSLASSSSASTAAGRAGSAAAGNPTGGRRALLDRSAIRGPVATAPAAAEQVAASNSGRAEAGSTKRRGGSSSDTDDDDTAAAGARGAAAQPSTSGRTSGSSTSSRIPTVSPTARAGPPGSAAASPGSAARGPAAAAAGDGAGDAAAARLLSENEKLRAQLVALRDAAAASEEARRLARLAAETAAAERDDCRAQAQELQDQLKEAIVGMITAEEASELAGQVRSLQLELQQQADQHLHQLQQQAGELEAAQSQEQQQVQQLLAAADERLHLLQQQLSQQTRDADEQLQALQQQLDQANEQLQQQQQQQQQQELQREESQQLADRSGGQKSVDELQQLLVAMSQQIKEGVVLVTHAERQKKQLADQVDGLVEQLESLRQHQRQQEEAVAASASSKPASGDVPGISSLVLSLRSKLAEAEQGACAAEKQRDDVLARLVDEASAAGRQPVLSQQLASRQDLATQVQESLSDLELDEGVQGMACQVLLTLRAAAAAAGQGAESEGRLASKIKVLTAALDDADRELRSLKSAGQHEQQQQCKEGMVVELQRQLDQLQQQNAQLQQQLAPLPAKLSLQPADNAASQGHSPLIRAGLQGFEASPGSSLGSSRDGDSGSQVLLHGGDDQVLQLQAALHAALADGQQCRRKLQAREKELQLVQANDASGSGQPQMLLAVQQQLDGAHSRMQQVLQDRSKLQAVLTDMEAAAAQEKAELLGQLAAAHQELRQTVLQKEQTQRQLADASQGLAQQQTQLQQIQRQLSSAQQEQQRLHQCLEAAEAAATPAVPAAEQRACQVIALADSAGPSGTQEALGASQEQVAELQRQLGEAEATRRSLAKECGRLKKQLADEQAERTTLENQLAQHLEDTGDDLAQEAVAAYEAKYTRLKSRYRQLTEVHHEEVDQLHQEIAALQERTLQLEALTAQLEADRSQAKHSEVTLAETLQKTSKVSSELATLRQENQTLMQELVGAKLELAVCSEREVIGRRELYKAKEANMKLASKMTKLETLVYNRK